MTIWRRALPFIALLGAAGAAPAVDYRSVDVPAAVLYDSPSQKGKKLYLIKAQTPVEVIVRLEGWFKIRDAEGSLAWVESRYLGDRRTLVVTALKAEIRQSDKADSPVVLELDKWVAVELVEPASPGWAKVRHRDGVTGYIRSTQVWGL
ncbi:SH3 domain-containing protein [Dechloromonas sp. TW-R-39-2]|uniref:SH3 domain-containing protein n=1 Tax=Dechloromonas sp. TW-R-39-2 TaxID=2654218 RepID=UPI00193D0583|nr:SH3 domain-containing protein [Dechloromonas sp. TW-R-39-2]QRM18809.1 SH3 domain-containing protein [Dechloromonas sp. TW-R-39-2]